MDYEQIMADTYDAIYALVRDPSGDRAFYKELAVASGGPVLELGCGTGRVLLPIAEAGIPIVGVDASEKMLAVLRSKGPPAHVRLVHARMEALSLERRDFRLCIVPFRAFQHLLDVDSQLKALAAIREHLAPGGKLALDLFEPDMARMVVEVEPEQGDTPFPHGGRQLVRRHSVRRDKVAQVTNVAFRYLDAEDGTEVGSERIQMRWTWRYELEHLLVRAGFVPESWSSGYDGRPYVGKGDIVVVARRA